MTKNYSCHPYRTATVSSSFLTLGTTLCSMYVLFYERFEPIWMKYDTRKARTQTVIIELSEILVISWALWNKLSKKYRKSEFNSGTWWNYMHKLYLLRFFTHSSSIQFEVFWCQNFVLSWRWPWNELAIRGQVMTVCPPLGDMVVAACPYFGDMVMEVCPQRGWHMSPKGTT
jgi:hypothetical protein